ncbi:hypothetical protein LUZ63_008442 [Rhynchospora breviuscula]|uniref:GDSL esterase/lipase n=1 Tax=Rhynchospora breviuscula TaxID=2022672 RepID=A0A9Q0HVZ3_9POAL|nr:hypothetical protein LUZ63_008442 [Rhynchospora breviuscula]
MSFVHKHKPCVLLLLMFSLLNYTYVTRADVSAVIVFGDSTVDSGNNNFITTIAKSNFRPYGKDYCGGVPTGRFSNGRLPTDFISEAFGLPQIVPAFLDPSYTIKHFASGVCFASAGTGWDRATAGIFNVISIRKQLEYYKQYQRMLKEHQGEAKAKRTLREALHVISLGSNDFIENYFLLPICSSQFTVSEYVSFLISIVNNFVQEIYKLGARKIGIICLGPIGCIPMERTINFAALGNCREETNDAAREFNVKLQQLVATLNTELRGLRIVLGDIFDLGLDIISNPSAYGFKNIAKGCCWTGLFEVSILCNSLSPTCRNADKYGFWDAVHLSQSAYHIVAEYLLETAFSVFL